MIPKGFYVLGCGGYAMRRYRKSDGTTVVDAFKAEPFDRYEEAREKAVFLDPNGLTWGVDHVIRGPEDSNA